MQQYAFHRKCTQNETQRKHQKQKDKVILTNQRNAEDNITVGRKIYIKENKIEVYK